MKHKRRNIVLIGFMGSGKTTLGLKLSYLLRMPVEDTDKLIERQEGRSITQIFADDGESYFRELETELLRKCGEQKYERILSVGGGTPVNPVNRPLLHQCGTVVYLRVSPEVVYERLKNDTTRPLLQCEDPLTRIRELLEIRDKIYAECADIILDVDNRHSDELAEELQLQLRKQKDIQRKKERKKMKILVINGPNLNFLGIREKKIYGTQDYQYLLDLIDKKAKETGEEIQVFQSNHEGAIIDRIQEAYSDGTEGIVINPGAYTHYSYAIRDALASVDIPKVEIHISDITSREEFRKISVTAPVCNRQIYGQGLDGYLQAIDFLRENRQISAGDFRNGITIEYDNNVYQIIEFQHVKPGKGAAFVRTKLKNIKSGGVVEKTFRPTEKCPQARIDRKDMQYLYEDGDLYYFMDTETYDQVALNSETVGDALKFVKENEMCKICSHNGSVFSVEPPLFVELEITETEPGFKGDTATGASKPATVETGATVAVPLFVNQGDKIKIDTRTGEYLSRA